MWTSDQKYRRETNMDTKSNEFQSGAKHTFKGKLIWPHNGKIALAEGNLEVCSLVVLVTVTSRFGLAALAVFAFFVGMINELAFAELLDRFAR